MFHNWKSRLQTVQHDLSQGLKSIADKAKSVNKKITRRTTFITDDILESGDQCFSCELEAGSEILDKYQNDWVKMHHETVEAAEKAEKADATLTKVLASSTEVYNTMIVFHGELALVSEMISNVDSAQTNIDGIAIQMKVIEELMLELEEVCENLDLQRRMSTHRLYVALKQQKNEDELEKMQEDFEQEKEHKQEREENIERQASVEKQHVYNDAFIQQMRYYEQFGETEKPISAMLESGRSLADISLDDAAGLDQLDEFLGPVTDETVSEDPGDDLLRNDNGARNCETGQKKKGHVTTSESTVPAQDAMTTG